MQTNLYRNYFKKLLSIVLYIGFLSFLTAAIRAQGETVAAAKSNLTAINLPTGAVRVVESSVPAEINTALEKLVAAGEGKIRQGNQEVLAWTNGYKKSNAPALIKQVTGNLQTSGWTYEVGSQDNDLTVFSVLRSAPTKRALLGFYTFSDEALVLAWTEILPSGSNNQTNNSTIVDNSNDDSRPANVNSAASVLKVEKNTTYVNVMGKEMPAMPMFSALAPKPGRVRGYVKDASGKPLAGATLGVRSTLLGGMYSGAQGVTDAKGYYEFVIPSGAAHFYNAGYAIEWGDGVAALGLHPADGKLESFASPDGAVENFVLLSYGITSRESLSENPRLASTYYGGSIYVGYYVVGESDNNAPSGSVVENSVVEITLTPEGKLFDGSEGKSFVVRKTAGFDTGFKINNIPLGRYKISAKLSNGKPLKMKLNRPTQTVFGMTPTETTASASVLFFPNAADAKMVSPNYGNWNAVEISVEAP